MRDLQGKSLIQPAFPHTRYAGGEMVLVAVGVAVFVGVAVSVGVDVGVAVAVDVFVGVAVDDGVAVAEGGTAVDVAVGGARVALGVGVTVAVADGTGETSANAGSELASTSGVSQEVGREANPAAPAAAASALMLCRRETLLILDVPVLTHGILK